MKPQLQIREPKTTIPLIKPAAGATNGPVSAAMQWPISPIVAVHPPANTHQAMGRECCESPTATNDYASMVLTASHSPVEPDSHHQAHHQPSHHKHQMGTPLLSARRAFFEGGQPQLSPHTGCMQQTASTEAPTLRLRDVVNMGCNGGGMGGQRLPQPPPRSALPPKPPLPASMPPPPYSLTAAGATTISVPGLNGNRQ